MMENGTTLSNVWGKVCFGFEENCQFVQAEAAGERALEHTPRDIWAIHSMSHVHEETGRGVLLVRLPSVVL